MYEITYQKSNGEVFIRTRFSMPQFYISGSGAGRKMITSMGWTILQIKRV